MAKAGDTIENPVTGERIVFCRTAAETGGELLEFDDFWTKPGRRAPEHVHPEIEERWEVISGSARFRIGGVERTLGPGETAVAQPGTPHVGWNPGPDEAHLRVQMRPALRWQELVERLFALAREGRTDELGVPEPVVLAELLREFEREIAPAPADGRDETDSEGRDETDSERLAQAIDALDEREKLLATLIWFETLGLDEAAEKLKLSVEDAALSHERAATHVAAEVLAGERPGHLAEWSRAAVDVECAAAWRRYDAELAEHYTSYFTRYPELRGDHPYSACDLAAALPPGWSELSERIRPREWHTHCLSGKSSQTLALGLLGVSTQLDPSLAWLWEALSPLPPATTQLPQIAFERPLDPEVLDEHPRQTAVDVLVEDPNVLVCIEVKWREDGLGTCSCGNNSGNPLVGRCANRVENRAMYWEAASNCFGLPERRPPGPCTISLAYQAVRNAAAARALAGLAGPERLAVFALIYDARNPYFAGCGSWPGWPQILEDAAEHADPERFRFRAVSWQELFPLLALDEPTSEWAAEKHGLGRA